jgi:puromycin-sensitive aminopeptidase
VSARADRVLFRERSGFRNRVTSALWFNMNNANFRLSREIQAERYIYTIAPDLNQKTFSGQGRVELRIRQSTNRIVLHGVALDIVRATVGGDAIKVVADPVAQTLCFELPATMSGVLTLQLEWKGKFHNDLRGFYQAGTIGVTQFETDHARRVFPCLDEPGFKAVWELSLEVPAELSAISNGAVISEKRIEGGKKQIGFAPTPRMSSYLVALVVGELVSSEPIDVAGIPIRTWAVPEKVALTRFAQQCAAAVLPMLEAYFGMRYAFSKLDQIGVPDFEAGAMENSGCITYREIALLLDEQRAPVNARKRAAEVIAHEISHQWFGNLVTMQWWDDLWLNEAFATWMAYKIVDQWKPQWRMWDDFEKGRQTALRLDALSSSHPIRSEVKNAGQAVENFDAITYEKGAAMLRMLEGFMGEGRFRSGIGAYMVKHQYANAVADDLWNALEETSGHPIAQIAHAWLDREGYPIVGLESEGGSVSLTQERFALDPEVSGEVEPWIIPVILRYHDGDGLKTQSVLMQDRTQRVDLDCDCIQWICGNADAAGFYRVQYCDRDLRALTDGLQNLKPVEVVNLISDTWAAFRTKRVVLPTFLELLERVAVVSDYTVAREIAQRFSALEQLCTTNTSRAGFRKWVAVIVRPLFEQVGWGNESRARETSLLRTALLRSLAEVAREDIAVRELTERLNADWQNRLPLDPNLLDVAWVVTARHGDASLFERLLERAETETDPMAKRRALLSLAAFEAQELHHRVIHLILDQVVPMQDVTTYLNALVRNRSLHEQLWDFVQTRWDELRARCAAPFLTRRLVEALGGLIEYPDKVEILFEDKAEELRNVPAAVRQTRERMRLDADVHRRGAPALSSWLEGQ